MSETAYKSIWSGAEIDEGIAYVQDLKHNDSLQQLQQLTMQTDKLSKQLKQLEDQLVRLKDEPLNYITVTETIPSTTVPENVANLFILNNADKEFILCYKMYNGTVIKLAPVDIKASDLQLYVDSALIKTS